MSMTRGRLEAGVAIYDPVPRAVAIDEDQDVAVAESRRASM